MARFWVFIFFLFFPFFFSQAALNSHLLLQNESFVSPNYQATNQNSYQFFGFNLKSNSESDKMAVDGEAVIAIGAPLLNYLKFSEFAMVIPNSKTQTLILGRKKKVWSEIDENWALGLIEPVFKWNPLNRESQGLTGLFWQSQESWFDLTAFVSSVYLPDQGPSYEINRQGQFSKSNPWFQMPPKTFQPFPNSTASSDIQYNIRKPPESEIISQTSLGGSLQGRFNQTTSAGGLWRTAYFFKPMNQLLLGYDGVYNTGTDTGEVEILPQVAYHRVVSGDLVYDFGDIRLGTSFMSDRPENVQFADEWTAPVLSDAQIYAGSFRYLLGNQKFKIEYLTIEGGKVSEKGEFADPKRATITSRYPFKQAIKSSYEFDFSFKKQEKMKLVLSWTHSDKNVFDLVQLKGNYQVSRLWQFYADMQLVKAKSLNGKNENEIFPQENNDRLMIGTSYEL